MAHKFLYEPSFCVLPYNLDNIGIQVDGPFVDVSIARSTNAKYVTFFQERFYPHNGIVTLCDIASLVISEMRSAGLSFTTLKFTAFSDSPSNNSVVLIQRVIFCDHFSVYADPYILVRENFLTTLSYRRVAPNAELLLPLFALKADSLTHSIHYICQKPDGSSFCNSMTVDPDRIATSNDVVELNISCSAILQDAASFSGLKPNELKLLSFSVNCGKRSVSCFVDPLIDFKDSFLFRNCFNAREYACLPAITSVKTNVDRSTALINRKASFYDATTEKLYEVQAGPLLPDEADWIDQLLCSYEVWRLEHDHSKVSDKYVLTPVIITDSSCEISDADDKPNSVKFSWRHTDSRPIVHLPFSPGIFSSQFDFRFS